MGSYTNYNTGNKGPAYTTSSFKSSSSLDKVSYSIASLEALKRDVEEKKREYEAAQAKLSGARKEIQMNVNNMDPETKQMLLDMLMGDQDTNSYGKGNHI